MYKTDYANMTSCLIYDPYTALDLLRSGEHDFLLYLQENNKNELIDRLLKEDQKVVSKALYNLKTFHIPFRQAIKDGDTAALEKIYNDTPTELKRSILADTYALEFALENDRTEILECLWDLYPKDLQDEILNDITSGHIRQAVGYPTYDITEEEDRQVLEMSYKLKDLGPNKIKNKILQGERECKEFYIPFVQSIKNEDIKLIDELLTKNVEPQKTSVLVEFRGFISDSALHSLNQKILELLLNQAQELENKFLQELAANLLKQPGSAGWLIIKIREWIPQSIDYKIGYLLCTTFREWETNEDSKASFQQDINYQPLGDNKDSREDTD